MRHVSSLATILAVAIIVLTPPLAAAGDSDDPWWAPRLRLKDTVDGAAGPASTVPASAPSPAQPPPILPDSALNDTMTLVRKSTIGSDPNVIAYLDLMSAGQASAAQVNDFAAYVAKRGMPKVAISFQQYALRLEPQNATLWLNLGTLQRTTAAFGSAETSFKKAITIDPINALAHYNLGAVYDVQGDYDNAIEEYRRALVLDPGLADPRKNPQVVNNENLLAVELEIYQSQAGALGLPLLQMQEPSPPPKAAPGKK